MGWTLAVAFAAVAVALGVRLRSKRSGDPRPSAPLSDRYRIQGRIEVTSTCMGSAASVPTELRVTAVLTDGRQSRVEAVTDVSLRDLGTDADGERRLEGAYELEAAWVAEKPPVSWEPPRATRVDGGEPCESLACDGPNRCVNIASRPRRIELVQVDTEFTLRVACICVPD